MSYPLFLWTYIMINILMPLKRSSPVIPYPVIKQLFKQKLRFNLYVDVSIDLHGDSERDGVCQNICNKRNRLKERCKSIFVFWLDADVVIPDSSLPQLVHALRSDERIGVIGIRYVGHTSRLHIALGTAMMRRTVLLSLPPFRYRYLLGDRFCCECTVMGADLKHAGYKSLYHPRLIASHIKRWQCPNKGVVVRVPDEFELSDVELWRLTRGERSIHIEVT